LVFLIGVIVGALVGSTVALLLAPEAGGQLRSEIRERARLSWRKCGRRRITGASNCRAGWKNCAPREAEQRAIA